MPFLLGIDVGTTAVKSAIFSDDGLLIDQANADMRPIIPIKMRPSKNRTIGGEAVVVTVREILEKTRIQSSAIAAIAVSSQGPTMLAVDKTGRPVYPALIWMDQRADDACAFLREKIGEDLIFRTTGNAISSAIAFCRNSCG